jgi:hypothetical protein
MKTPGLWMCMSSTYVSDFAYTDTVPNRRSRHPVSCTFMHKFVFCVLKGSCILKRQANCSRPSCKLCCTSKKLFFMFADTLRWVMLPVPPSKDCVGRQCPVPYMRYGHTAVSWDCNAFVWGGRNDKNGTCNGLFSFNTGSTFLLFLQMTDDRF